MPVTIATAMAADVMRQMCFSVRRGPRRQIVEAVLFFTDGSKKETTRPVLISDQTFLSAINGYNQHCQ